MSYGASDMLTLHEVGADSEAIVDVTVRLGDIPYSAIQSAISFLYQQSGIDRPTEWKVGISMY